MTTILSRNVTILFEKRELELESREKKLELIIGWAKELDLELIFQPKKRELELEYIEGIGLITGHG